MTSVASNPHTIDSILTELRRFKQRATYGAVAAFLKKSPRNLMEGRTRDPGDSWIVSSSSGLPTGYTPEQTDPDIKLREGIIKSPGDLESWLENPS